MEGASYTFDQGIYNFTGSLTIWEDQTMFCSGCSNLNLDLQLEEEQGQCRVFVTLPLDSQNTSNRASSKDPKYQWAPNMLLGLLACKDGFL